VLVWRQHQGPPAGSYCVGCISQAKPGTNSSLPGVGAAWVESENIPEKRVSLSHLPSTQPSEAEPHLRIEVLGAKPVGQAEPLNGSSDRVGPVCPPCALKRRVRRWWALRLRRNPRRNEQKRCQSKTTASGQGMYVQVHGDRAIY
jgi:hypothetical protein